MTTFSIDSLIGATWVTGTLPTVPADTLAKCIARLEALEADGFTIGADMLVGFKTEAASREPAKPLVSVLSNEIEEEEEEEVEVVEALTVKNCRFANLHGHSDVEPFQIVKVVSDKTIEVRRLKADLDPTWKPEMHVGGFAAHCSNQHSQRWIYAVDPDAPVLRARLRKDGRFHSPYGAHRLAKAPRKFHDYNF